MPETPAISLDEQIACIDRELELRRRVYGRRVADGTMTPSRADLEMRRMEAVRESLQRVKDTAR